MNAKPLGREELALLQQVLAKNELFRRMMASTIADMESRIIAAAASGGMSEAERYRTEGAYQQLLRLRAALIIDNAPIQTRNIP